jgi:assimilatory nitrate reductase catalytic subunit
MDVGHTPDGFEIRGREFPVNNGALCIKGWTASEALTHPDRLRTPLARTREGTLAPVSWDEAMGLLTDAIVETQRRYGPEAVGVLGGGSLTNEKAYLLGKFARVGLGTSKIDYNGRFCMSSAAAASIRTFGIDRGLPFPIQDIAKADVVLLAGSNPAETMPPIMQYFEAQRAAGGRLIVTDPRLTPTAETATLHLKNVPGTDAALANGLLHLLVRNRAIDIPYIEARTEGFDQVRAAVAAYWPEHVERVTGVPESQLVEAAGILSTARTVMVLTGRGIEQQAQGVNNTLAFINIALALGMVGRPYAGYGTLTGQGNGQGGREHGQKADQLPGYRLITDPAARRHVAAVWGVPAESLPEAGISAYEMLDQIGEDGGVRSLIVSGTNPVVSSPNGLRVEDRLGALDYLAVADFFVSETAEMANLVLPTAQWAEEDGTMTNLEGRVILRKKAVDLPAGVRTEIDIICDLAERLGRGKYFRYADTESVFYELRRASAGGVADYSGITYDKIRDTGGVYWPCPTENHPGTPRLFGTEVVDGDRFLPPPGFFTSNGRARFHAIRHAASAEVPDDEFPLYFTTGRLLAQYQSGTQTRRLEKLHEMAPEPTLEVHPILGIRYRFRDGDPVTVTTRRGKATFRARLSTGIREDTAFAPFHWAGTGSANRLTNPALDPTSRMPEFKVCAARIERAAHEDA